MTALVFSMVGLPRGQGRPRATVRGAHATVYKAQKDRKYETSVAKVAMGAMAGRAPFEGPLSVSLRFRMPIPASASKRTKAAMAAGEIAPTTKPDLSNLVKSIEDAMNRIVFADDSQIVRNFNTKIYAEQPGVDVRVEAFAPQGGDA
jgi:Holliday junction resolvase RusA-like endonuclease